MTDITVPTLGESVTEATVGQWLKSAGDAVRKDDVLVELETDKVSVEVSATEDGVLSEIIAAEGVTVEIGALLGKVSAGAGGAASAPAKEARVSQAAATTPTPAQTGASAAGRGDRPVSPSVRRVSTEAGVNPSDIPGTGRDGRATKADALAYVNRPKEAAAPAAARSRDVGPREERVRMTRLRQTIARRLKEAQETAAMLTTFNDVDMGAIMDLRKKYKEPFLDKH
ncbi:UNVERIFIED_CONTAM: hypothetical protein GTU68_009945, partial [Idotea baltica]|nr:hypothetical protein [Idotea baltica]